MLTVPVPSTQYTYSLAFIFLKYLNIGFVRLNDANPLEKFLQRRTNKGDIYDEITFWNCNCKIYAIGAYSISSIFNVLFQLCRFHRTNWCTVKTLHENSGADRKPSKCCAIRAGLPRTIDKIYWHLSERFVHWHYSHFIRTNQWKPNFLILFL